MAKKTPLPKKFTIAVSVTGNLSAAYVFEDEAKYQAWMGSTLPTLEKEFGKLTTRKSALPGFMPGDRCMVYGEGSEVFEIERVIRYSEHRFGFVFKGHGSEEVAKCFWENRADAWRRVKA